MDGNVENVVAGHIILMKIVVRSQAYIGNRTVLDKTFLDDFIQGCEREFCDPDRFVCNNVMVVIERKGTI